MLIYSIIGIVAIVYLGICNKKLKVEKSELQANNTELQLKYEEINKNYKDIKEENSNLEKQYEENKTIISQLELENKTLKEENSSLVSSGTVNNYAETTISSTNNSNSSGNSNTNSSISDLENTVVDEKSKMIEKAHKFFADRGIEIDTNQYSEMLGTNLHSGINELEGHRVFAFTIKNYDIVSNNVWFYYSPDTNVGYRYENETWTQL